LRNPSGIRRFSAERKSLEVKCNFQGLDAMIMREWRGRLPQDRGDDYFEYLKVTGLPEYVLA
jgi:hypothetical protein